MPGAHPSWVAVGGCTPRRLDALNTCFSLRRAAGRSAPFHHLCPLCRSLVALGGNPATVQPPNYRGLLRVTGGSPSPTPAQTPARSGPLSCRGAGRARASFPAGSVRGTALPLDAPTPPALSPLGCPPQGYPPPPALIPVSSGASSGCLARSRVGMPT